jgi:purine nucleosidase
LIWLFSQTRHPVDVQGVVTIAGATTVTNATYNTQLILSWLGEETVPVIQGADAPLVQPLSLTPSLVHGPDGLWFTFAPEVPPDSSDATAFYCAPQRLQPGLLVVALGPLTNLARAIQSCPAAWNGVEIVSMGGGKFKYNQTPVTEYNYWQDPEAAQQVLTQGAASGATIQIVLADAFSQFELAPNDIQRLNRHGVPAIVNLLPALETYINALSAGGEAPILPDPVAVIYALENTLGTAQSALVKPLAGEGIPEMVRGQTIIGITLNERITMIASDAELSAIAYNIYNTPGYDLDSALFEILSREPDNALVVTDIEARRMHNLFLRELRGNDVNLQSSEASNEMDDFEEHLFVPLIMD